MKGSLKYVFAMMMMMLQLSCKNQNDHQNPNQSDATLNVYYTCSMHPSVRSDKPGNCPICGMDLVKKEEKKGHQNMLHLTKEQKLVVNIKIDTAKITDLTTYTSMLGTVVEDRTTKETISARINGRIEKLYLKNPRAEIKKGQILFSLYSEELQSSQADLLNTIEQLEKHNGQKEVLKELIRSTKNKLLLWGLSEKQIDEMIKKGTASPVSDFYSPVSGFLTDLKVIEGDYVREGSSLFEIVDLRTVWVEAQSYERDEQTSSKTSVIVEFDALPKEEFKGTLVYNSPSLEENKKISLIRYKILNPEKKIKPGMMARVQVAKEKQKTLAIPKSAILLEKMKTVWVETNPGMYERRMVTTGAENYKQVEIITGLSEGEKIVTSGGYLLASEYILQNSGSQNHNH